ncbi:MAG TPA: AAC(3) family N-acetyltransferase [Anaerolineae bacterium]|nr:AAC(3) family N-acetyltransferase [Anaerolineae bacterium]
MPVTLTDIQSAISQLELAGAALCVHASLHSFGQVEGGAQTVIAGLLRQGCTVMTPTHSYGTYYRPPPGQGPADPAIPLYTPTSDAVDAASMGAIPVCVLRQAGRVRGNHPLDSFTAVGPRAAQLAASQSPTDPYAPVRVLERLGGYIVLMGVGLNKLTALHHAERLAGRPLFTAWTQGNDGQPTQVNIGGCSEGFVHLDPVLAPIERQIRVGQSVWRVFPVAAMLTLAVAAIRANPPLTHCDDPACEECNINVRI